jgi:hypothetical protein
MLQHMASIVTTWLYMTLNGSYCIQSLGSNKKKLKRSGTSARGQGKSLKISSASRYCLLNTACYHVWRYEQRQRWGLKTQYKGQVRGNCVLTRLLLEWIWVKHVLEIQTELNWSKHKEMTVFLLRLWRIFRQDKRRIIIIREGHLSVQTSSWKDFFFWFQCTYMCYHPSATYYRPQFLRNQYSCQNSYWP